MDLGLKDKLIVITGGAAGIGEAITRAALAEGARVAILSRITPHVETFVAELRSSAARSVDLIPLELSDTKACTTAIRTIEQRHGDIFALVNNAGVNDSVSLATGTLDQWNQSLANNLTHAFVLAQQALPLLKRTQGTILNIASKVAVTGQGGTSGYAAAKGALLALTREWAVDLLPFNIRVNAILPAEVMTPLYETWLARQPNPAERLAAIQQRIPLGHRMTTPAEIAAAAVFLLSPTQSAHTTGQHLHIDGGYTHLDRAITWNKA
jgi:L-fucose dehydrogenase